ncbi:hypothetical protein BFP72_01450 [Reichenbachiella sp. 5M10]|uniref:hypothetical protein n=1 Tax=Reichenbachiella sp. 5M10 TaxID=1889772 RepID=UPI000C14F923|nr:hypothetical protein [Reichenbachiella sp. 5M10]PIB34187.1 hypothetical protein BFP72_01450 [Reichenbachiella sp. 5M10]
MKTTLLLCILSFYHLHAIVAQDYSLHVSESTFTINGTQYIGYETAFTLPYKQVKKQWWRYIKKKAHLFNYKTHYELTISGTNEELPVKFISQMLETESQGALLRLAPTGGDWTTQQVSSLRKDLKVMLVDFKIDYYTGIVQEQIKEQEKENKKTSKSLHRLKNSTSPQADKLKTQLSNGELKLDALKQNLTTIK